MILSSCITLEDSLYGLLCIVILFILCFDLFFRFNTSPITFTTSTLHVCKITPRLFGFGLCFYFCSNIINMKYLVPSRQEQARNKPRFKTCKDSKKIQDLLNRNAIFFVFLIQLLNLLIDLVRKLAIISVDLSIISNYFQA